ncbi:hypothetical protein SASPL_118241 [Salvia splendens]|uniref:F-box domain-containing protein n=1 Tax=Salvia splendens TaxID=180675 RepID=A0A8X8XZ10_SALSN|nr:F-box protein SKIP2-like [Salvia splendens]KAG6421684.1 hypothetical protein SASPL_118241 [Salvia splendens]
MGQAPSTHGHGYSPGASNRFHDDHHLCDSPNSHLLDLTAEIPDECLALIFQSLPSTDRNSCSLVSRRWLSVDSQSRHRLALNASSSLSPLLPSLLSRFDSVTKLALRCDRKSVSIDDDSLSLISLRFPNLSRLKLRGCRQISDVGMLALASNCKSLRKFSCGSCMFGAKGINALLDNSSSLEELSVKRLRGINDGFAAEPIGPGAAAASLKSITLKELYNGQCFAPLIVGSRNLKTLKILRCLGDWDRLLESITLGKNCLSEIHLERLQVSDFGLIAISRCPNLEIFHLVKAPDCSNLGILAIAENCRVLRKVHIDGWRTNRIGDEGLLCIAKNSANLVELVLIGVNLSSASLTAMAMNCRKLERLALCGSETIGDDEITCVADKCVALKKLCIKGCRVTDSGIEAFAFGCPNLVKIKVKKCRGVTSEVADWLRARRVALSVSLDADEVEPEAATATATDYALDFPPIGDAPPSTRNAAAPRLPNKSRFSLLAGRALVACAFRRLSSANANAASNPWI